MLSTLWYPELGAMPWQVELGNLSRVVLCHAFRSLLIWRHQDQKMGTLCTYKS